MNNKGSIAILFFMVAVLFFVLAMALAPSLTETSRDAYDDLNCTNSTITDSTKTTCYQIDTFSPLYVGVILGLGGIILARVMM